MITTDSTYNTLIASGSYEESITGTLKDGSGTTVLNISNEYIKTGSLIIDNKCINNDDLEPGAVYAAELKITITGNAGLTSSQKSSLQNGSLNLTYTITDGNSSSSISIGIYYIIEVTLKDEDVEIIAEDMMSRLSKNIPTAVRESLAITVNTPYELLLAAAENCSTTQRPITLVNDETEFESWCNADATFEIPVTADIATYRDLVAEVAKIMGCFATIDKSTNGLILKRLNPHSNSNVWTLNEDIRYSTEKSGYVCLFGKISLGNVSYPTTSDDDVSGLILSMRASELTDDSEVLPGIVQNLYTELSGISYRPCKIDFMGNIALEVGDWIGVNYTEDEQTYTFRTIITHFTWILNGKELIESTGSSAATTKKVGSKGSNESRNSSSIDNLESRIETLESAQGGKEVYYGTSLPTADIGQDSSLYYKTIQRPEDLKTLNVVEYIQSASGTYIPTDILLTSTTRIMMQGTFYRGYYEGRIAFGTEGRDSSGNVGRFVAITSSSSDISNCDFFFGNKDGSCEGIYETDVMLIADTATRTLTISGNGTSHSVTVSSGSLYTPSSTPIGILCTNTSSEAGGFSTYSDYRKMNPSAIIKRFQVYENNVLSYDLIPVQNANDVTDCGLYDRIHRKYYQGKNYNNIPFTAGTPTGEVINQLDECVEAGYLRVNDEWWEIYNGGTEYFAGNYIEITENNVITSTLKAGTNIQIADDGTISASGAVTVTPITTTGTNIANIEVDGTTYQLFAPSGGGGGSGSGYTETSLWSGYKADTGTITLSDSVENYDVVLIKVTSHPNQPSTQYYESYFTILTKDIIYNQQAQYCILAIRATAHYGDGSLDCYFSNSTSFVIETISIDGSARNVKPAILEVIGLKFGGSSGHNYSTNEQVIGTWIDGSTIYERTYDLGSDLTLQDSTWTDIGISVPTNANRCIKAEGIQSDGTSTCIMASVTSTNITVQSTKNSGDSIRYLTIQYTKTS